MVDPAAMDNGINMKYPASEGIEIVGVNSMKCSKKLFCLLLVSADKIASDGEFSV